MSKSFLITSHTEGAHAFEQRTILNGLVKSLKQFFPDCFIVVASQSQVDVETQMLSDFVIVNKVASNVPHGAGELVLIKQASKILKEQGITNFYKLCYDFVIDSTNVGVFDQWASLGKEFVSCYWHTTGLGIGTWIWYSTVEIIDSLFDFDHLDKYLEWALLESVSNKALLDRCFLYYDQDEMFNGDWFDRCDLVHAGGSVLKHKYGTVVAILALTDQSEVYFPLTLQSLANQTKTPDHLVIVDYRTNKQDLRLRVECQDLFELLSNHRVSWNLIYGIDSTALVTYLAELGHDWCWIVPESTLLDHNMLKKFYSTIILNYHIGTVSHSDGNVFYRNSVINIGKINKDIRQHVVDKMLETSYNNISC